MAQIYGIEEGGSTRPFSSPQGRVPEPNSLVGRVPPPGSLVPPPAPLCHPAHPTRPCHSPRQRAENLPRVAVVLVRIENTPDKLARFIHIAPQAVVDARKQGDL